MLIIGITGTLGAGKGTIVDYLTGRHAFKHYSVRGLLTEIIQSRGLDANRSTMVAVANELRSRHSPSYLVERLYELAAEGGQDCVIESIRTPGEVERLRACGRFVLLAVDAPRETRYRRIRLRDSSTDQVSFERFVSDEEREMRSGDPREQNLSRCIAMADYVLTNDGSIDELGAKVEGVLEEIRGGRG